jgi:hypothetical protein
MYRLFSLYSLFRVALLVEILFFTYPLPSQAGCGCEKPPPVPASIRPNVTYGGTAVTLFGSAITTGQFYNVTFNAIDGTAATVSSVRAVSKRDLADAAYKSQLVVTVPNSLPLGPVGITITRAGQNAILLSVPDTSFTVAPQPIMVPSQPGSYRYQNYQAAVGRDGQVYISLDVTGMTQPRTIKAQAKGWPLRFTKDSTVFYNTQGFLMQMVNAAIPGLATITPSSSADSDVLQYQRHEFNTYFLQHVENKAHSTDPNDGNWHTDGTRHIDHDHLILAIAGQVNNFTPAAGATPAFTFVLNTYTFFHSGAVGINSVKLDASNITYSYNSKTNVSSSQAEVLSNGPVILGALTALKGNATGSSFTLGLGAQITGKRTISTTPVQYIPVDVPNGLTDLGSLNVGLLASRTLGPGSYKASFIGVTGGVLTINNTAGPVTIYVTGGVSVTAGSIRITDPNPEKFAIYVAGTSGVYINLAANFYGVIYAPKSPVTLSSASDFFGAFVGKTLHAHPLSKLHYDIALRGE